MKSGLLSTKLFLHLVGLIRNTFLKSQQMWLKWQLQGPLNRNPLIQLSKDAPFRLYERYSSFDRLRTKGFITILKNCLALSRGWGRRFGLLLFFVITILLPIIFGVGCNGGGGGKEEPTSPTPTPPIISHSRKIFVANIAGNSISVFDADASGNVAPIRSIGSNTELFLPSGVFVDTKNDEIFVTNFDNNTITVYERTADGDVSPLRIIRGPNAGLVGPSGIYVDTENDEIFVTNFISNTIVVYGRTDAGNILPLRTIGGPNTRLFRPVGIFIDTVHDEIFVANYLFNNEILVYKRSDKGDVLPSRTINISELTDEGIAFLPNSIYVDTENDEIFIADIALEEAPGDIQQVVESTIKVYRRTDEGNVSPLRIIKGSNTGLFDPEGIFVDKENHEIFVVNFFNSTVTVYRRTDTGNVFPLRTLSIVDSNNAGALARRMSHAIFVDTNNNEIFVANFNNTITVYRRTDEGDASPLRIIGPNTGLLNPVWIFVDTENSEIFVSNISSRLITVYGITDERNTPPLRTISQGVLSSQNGIFVDSNNDEILVAIFPPQSAITALRRADEGNVSPLRIIRGLNTRLEGPEGIFVDKENHEIFVTNLGNNAITVYGRTDVGDVSPLRVIEGMNTQLFLPLGIFVDAEHDEIFIANLDSITVYSSIDTGNAFPIRIIQGPDTKLFGPIGVFVDGNEIFVTNFNNTITVYDRIGNGNVLPKRIIAGPVTELDIPGGIFVADTP